MANARTIDIRQGGIGRAVADDIAITTGGIGFARGDRVSVEMGGIGAALAGEVRITQGGAGTILAREVRIEQAGVRTIIANHVHVERTTGVLFLIARRVDGDVRALLDWRGALAFGAAFGSVASLLRRRRRWDPRDVAGPPAVAGDDPRLYSTTGRRASSASTSPAEPISPIGAHRRRDRPLRARPRDGGPRARRDRRGRDEHLASGPGPDQDVNAPALMALTDIVTSPCPVIKTTGRSIFDSTSSS